MGNSESRAKYLAKNTAIFAIGNIGTKLISFFLVPLYTYVLSKEDYGTIDLIFSVCSVITPILMCNIGEAVKRYSLDKDAEHHKILTVSYIWIIFGIVIGLIILPVCGAVSIVHEYSVYIYLYAVLSATYVVFTDYLRGKEQLKEYTVCSLLTTAFIAGFNILFLVVFQEKIYGYLKAYIGAYLLTTALAFVFSKQYKLFSKFEFDKALFWDMSKFAITLVPNSLLWWITNSSDRLMVSKMVSVAANGLYTVSYKLPSLMSTLSTIFMQAWQYSAIRENESSDREEYNRSMYDAYVRFVSLTAAGLLLILRPFMHFYVSPEFFEAWKYSPFLILGYVFMTLATFVGTSYYVEKNMIGNMLSALVGAGTNICLNLCLIPKVGVNGAAIATCASYFIVLIYRVFDTKKYMRLNAARKEHIPIWGLLVLMVISTYFQEGIALALLCIEFVIMLFCNKKMAVSMCSIVLKKIKKQML
ncbi:MAG: oligosaccharide flippase family protein [Eubacterium sp.]|nr:oligosaccharide flippase family protein [Eubacterium sp.]